MYKKNYTKKSKEQLKKELTKTQYEVTQENGTERSFENEFWNNKEEGIYVDINSEEPLFTSLDKFDSGCGWPSFTKPVRNENVKENKDITHGMIRTEVRSKHGDNHLGHVYNDGPLDQGGLRYCINSAALKFIPVKNLKVEGYEEYLVLFKK